MPQKPKVSIIVPSYRQFKTVEHTLRSIKNQSFKDFELIVVDSSSDSTTDLIKKVCSDVSDFKWIEFSGRKIAAFQRNIGFKKSRADWLAFIDTDVVIPPHWLEDLIRRAMDHASPHTIWATSMKSLNPEAYWGQILFWIEFSEFMSSSITNKKFFLPSAALLVSRQTIETFGAFIEVPVCEDVLTVFQWKRQGCQLRFESDLACGHINRTHFLEIIKRCFWMGSGSAVMRKLNPQIPGAELVRQPWFWPFLWSIRVYKILRRILKSEPPKNFSGACSLIYHWPGLALGLVSWNLGFIQGCFSKTWPEEFKRMGDNLSVVEDNKSTKGESIS